MPLEYLHGRLVALGSYALSQGIFHHLDLAQAGLGLLALWLAALYLGTLMGARILAPGHPTEVLILTVAWTVLAGAFDAAQTLGPVQGPGPVAALAAFILGLMASATHFVLRLAWPAALLLMGICGALGAVFMTIGAEMLKLLNAI